MARRRAITEEQNHNEGFTNPNVKRVEKFGAVHPPAEPVEYESEEEEFEVGTNSHV